MRTALAAFLFGLMVAGAIAQNATSTLCSSMAGTSGTAVTLTTTSASNAIIWPVAASAPAPNPAPPKALEPIYESPWAGAWPSERRAR